MELTKNNSSLCFADSDPAFVEHVVNKELVVVCKWLRNNKMIIARNSEPLPLAKRDETLPCALFLFIGKYVEMIV